MIKRKFFLILILLFAGCFNKGSNFSEPKKADMKGLKARFVKKSDYDEFVTALSAGKLQELDIILAKNAEIIKGYPLIKLIKKIENLDFQKITLLLKHGADINAKDKRGFTSLHEAARRGISDIVKILLEIGANPNAKSDDEVTPLHCAVESGLLNTVEQLIKKDVKIEIDAADKFGYTALHKAARIGSLDIVKLLLGRKANPNARSNEEVTPLHCAVAGLSVKRAELLINSGAKVNAVDKFGYTPLHEAVKRGMSEMVELLINNGADTNARNENKITPLRYAVENGSEKVVKLLTKKELKTEIDAADTFGVTPLYVAAKMGNLAITMLLLERGADANAKTKMEIPSLYPIMEYGFVERVKKRRSDIITAVEPGFTALHEAALLGHVEIVKLLLTNKADVNAKSKRKITPLRCAAGHGPIQLVEFLISNGAKVNTADKYGFTALHEATKRGALDIVKLLLKSGADLEAKTKDKITPLHFAAQFNWLNEITVLLIKSGAEVNVADKDGITALHEASKIGNLDIIKLLLEQKALVNAKSNKNFTPLHFAVESGSIKSVELLIKGGAEVNVAVKDGNTPLHIAIDKVNGEINKESFLKIIMFLLDYEANLHIKNEDGLSPLDLCKDDNVLKYLLTRAVKEKDAKTATIILKKDGDWTNIKESDESTLLMYAAGGKDLDLVQLLVEKGYDAIDKDKDDSTVLMYAAEGGCPEIAEYLLNTIKKIGASDLKTYINQTNKLGDTALLIAVTRENVEVAELLVKLGADMKVCDSEGRTPLVIAGNKLEDEYFEKIREERVKGLFGVAK